MQGTAHLGNSLLARNSVLDAPPPISPIIEQPEAQQRDMGCHTTGAIVFVLSYCERQGVLLLQVCTPCGGRETPKPGVDATASVLDPQPRDLPSFSQGECVLRR